MHSKLGTISRSAAAAGSSHGRNSLRGTGEQRHGVNDSSFGVFQNVHINPFPVRAAIDIGTGGMMSLTVGRVDAGRNAVRDFMYQTQLPLDLQSTRAAELDAASFSSPFTLTENTRADIRNKMRLLHGALRRENYEGLSERAAVISWPLCEAQDAVSLAQDLTREFKVDVRVLGKTFEVMMPFANDNKAFIGFDQRASEQLSEECTRGGECGAPSGENDTFLQTLMHRITHKRGRKRKPVKPLTHSTLSAPQQMEQLAFLAHASVSKCMAPQRMLVFSEDVKRGLCILGMDTGVAGEEGLGGGTGSNPHEGCNSNALALPRTPNTSDVTIHSLPVDMALAHRLLITAVQRRCGEAGMEHRSPNPVLREEFRQLRNMLEKMVKPTLPSWVLSKSIAGGLVCGSSINGGVFNVAARVAQRTSISLDHLETHAEMHYCGLTDVLLAVNYPNAATVVPNAALASALMRSVETQRFEYLPEVNLSDALLLQPCLWIYARRRQVRDALGQKSFYSGGSIQRTFERPHMRENPSAPPTAAWQKNMDWNPLSYENSTRGM
ncbi:hypothetical protein ERJ75_001343100 [Trypanosoma vivax]|uniref:Uncharacterized protein n=1 Tax=Trypanosoma vivax (strain Y486) TaxID=1055687 RepID=G0U5X6_TRYVY|nr:hypothetical protein TRVL_01576 [Trypanosoma vivax]KAH8608098.1 hypothetical protein ERJ75_001343100 [Trypanosoma vivax]CCC51277.1 conserved hypothetical protein [Trypanosoma vivax Y486]